MRKIYFLLTISFLLFQAAFAFKIQQRKPSKAPKNGTITITLLETTDVHGNIYPYDYFRGEADNRGLAKAAALVKQYRRQNPLTLYLDDGDLIQGSPLTFLFNHKHPEYPNPMIIVLNAMGCDAFCVGNHDIEQGKKVYDKCRRESKFPWLAANSEITGGKTYFDPYVIKEIGGVRVGILGICTPGIPLWLNEDLYPGIEFTDMVETAKKWVPVLRQQEKVDVLVGLFHSGTNTEYDAEIARKQGLPLPNASRLVAEQVPGFDIIFTGHAHQVIPSERNQQYIFNGVPVIQAGRWGSNLGVADIDLKEENGRWKVSDIRVTMEYTGNIQPDSAILSLTDKYHTMTLEYIERSIGNTQIRLTGKTALFEDTPLLDLVNMVQLWASKADVSFASCFNTRFDLAPGDFTVRDVYSIYRYENFLNKIALTGRQIDAYLEYSAGYYAQYPFQSGDLTGDRISHYNVDAAAGIEYTIDLTKPKGERVEIMGFSDGRPFYPDTVYSAALNSYRAAGGGGYMVEAGAENAPILWKSSQDIRELIIDYFTENQCAEITCDKNWKITPSAAEAELKQAAE